MVKAVIFDMDGVIIDNGKYNKQAWREVLAKYGIEPSEEDFKLKISGRPTKVT